MTESAFPTRLDILANVISGNARAGVFFASGMQARIAANRIGVSAVDDTPVPNGASGIYLGCYFLGGLIGTAVLGQIFDRLGWVSCVAGIALALVTAALLAVGLRLQSDTVR